MQFKAAAAGPEVLGLLQLPPSASLLPVGCLHISFSPCRALGCREGSVIVDHDVIIEATYQENFTVTEQYTEILQRVNQTLTVLMESNCTTANFTDNLCIGNSTVAINEVPPKTEEDLCSEEVQEGYKDFFTYFIGVDGLECISHCNPDSENVYACSRGTCEIKINVGPHCLCTETDKYIYMDSRCNQRILKTSLFGGVGAAVGVVLIITVTVTVFLLRSMKKRKYNVSFYLEDKDDTWFESTDEWSDKGVVMYHGDESYVRFDDSSKNSFSSRNVNFQPNLENVDTSIKVTIQRPTISVA